jgi:hypothetical protein
VIRCGSRYADERRYQAEANAALPALRERSSSMAYRLGIGAQITALPPLNARLAIAIWRPKKVRHLLAKHHWLL